MKHNVMKEEEGRKIRILRQGKVKQGAFAVLCFYHLSVQFTFSILRQVPIC